MDYLFKLVPLCPLLKHCNKFDAGVPTTNYTTKNQSVIQCWFKLTGQNALNLKFKTHFSQIGLSLGKNIMWQNLLKILAELLWCNLFCEIRAQNFTPKMGHFGFSRLIKNYAENTQSITDIIISKWAPYAAQQTLWKVFSPKKLQIV